jgi:DNA-binding XRE family transcriptional regulator
MNVQIIKKDGSPEYAIIPYDEYERLMERSEMLEDVQDFDAARLAIEQGKEERVPAEVVNRILDGAPAIRVWREHRGLSASQLADACGITVAAISQIESGKRKPSVDTLKAIAMALTVDVDDLIN